MPKFKVIVDDECDPFEIEAKRWDIEDGVLVFRGILVSESAAFARWQCVVPVVEK